MLPLHRFPEGFGLNFFQEISQNHILWTAVSSWFVAQLIKFIAALVKTKRLSFWLFFSSGGMPSSHTSFVVALSTLLGIREGFDSPIFAIAAVTTAIVMYDATGVRQQAGKHAVVLNRLLQYLDDPSISLEMKLKELLGHTPRQVMAGAALGIAIAILSAVFHGY